MIMERNRRRMMNDESRGWGLNTMIEKRDDNESCMHVSYERRERERNESDDK